MRNPIGIGSAAALLALVWLQPGLTQDSCGDIEFSDDITQRFPRATEACIDIVEREGRPYAHFQAEIVDVQGGTVHAEFVAPDGTRSRTIAFTPPSDARVVIEGRRYRYSELTAGQELDVWLPPDRWEIAVPMDSGDFAGADSVTEVTLEDPQVALGEPTSDE